MKKNALIPFTILLLLFTHVNGQTNIFPSSGDAEIKTGKLLIETNTWRESLLTFRDIHYAPAQVYKFQLESDGLKIRQDNTVNYQFLSGGNFSINQGKLGVGTDAPASKIHVVTNEWMPSLLTFEDRHYSPAQVYKFQLESDGLKIRQDNTVNYQFLSGGNFIVNNGSVGIGTTLSQNPNSYKLAVNGKIGAKEVQVENTSATWADYVFESDYKLRSLDEVEAFIQKNKHLPEIPSKKEVEQNGHKLGEMDVLLLKKIEELTLYVIEQDKRIQTLEEKNIKLEEYNKAHKKQKRNKYLTLKQQ